MKTTSNLDHLSIASPCPANWEQMNGDEHVRFCDLCNLHVYNIAPLTPKEVETLIANTEGRICARIFRRADGTIMTKDCPVGLRAIRRQGAKVAGAVCAAVLSMFSTALSLTRPGVATLRPSELINTGVPMSPMISAAVSGTITDPNGDPIKNAEVTLINLKTNQQQTAKTDRKGRYRFQVSEFGSYNIKVHTPYFQPYGRTLSLHLSDDLRLDITLMIQGLTGVVVFQAAANRLRS
jgi:Carboxypeptidase regulatory-like domain